MKGSTEVSLCPFQVLLEEDFIAEKESVEFFGWTGFQSREQSFPKTGTALSSTQLALSSADLLEQPEILVLGFLQEQSGHADRVQRNSLEAELKFGKAPLHQGIGIGQGLGQLFSLRNGLVFFRPEVIHNPAVEFFCALADMEKMFGCQLPLLG